MKQTWPPDWGNRVRGEGCLMCDDGRAEELPNGVRFFRGHWSDAYLGRRGPCPGYAYVIWRGRHVAEPTELSDAEAWGYWQEVLGAARAIERVYSPCKMNYQLLGNAVPHLHAHLIPRYLDDVAPGRPLPNEAFEGGGVHIVADERLREDVATLRALLSTRDDGGH